MANRDAKLIERTLKDFSLGAMSGEGGSKVIPNPELTGDEPNLEGLEVDGAKYKVPQGGGSELYTIQVKGRTDGVERRNCSFTVQVDSKDIHTCQDLLDYLTDKGYYFNWTSGDGEGFILQATGQLDYYVITGIFTYSGKHISMQNTSPDVADLDPETVVITYLGE